MKSSELLVQRAIVQNDRMCCTCDRPLTRMFPVRLTWSIRWKAPEQSDRQCISKIHCVTDSVSVCSLQCARCDWILHPSHAVRIISPPFSSGFPFGCRWFAVNHWWSFSLMGQGFFLAALELINFWSTHRRSSENYRYWSFKNEPVGEVEECMFQVAICVNLLLMRLIGLNETNADQRISCTAYAVQGHFSIMFSSLKNSNVWIS